MGGSLDGVLHVGEVSKFGDQCETVSPRILGFLIVGIISLLKCSSKDMLYCAGSGVNSVEVVLALRENWFCCVQL